MCLRGKPGWGENMAYLGTLVNTYGGEWFNMEWKPEISSQPWKDAIGWYVKAMADYGPPGITSNGFNENQALFSTGHCAMWIDATSAAGRLYDPKQSQVADKLAFTKAPVKVTSNGSSWAWSWSLAVPKSTKNTDTVSATSHSVCIVTLLHELHRRRYSMPPGTRCARVLLPRRSHIAAMVTGQVGRQDTSPRQRLATFGYLDHQLVRS